MVVIRDIDPERHSKGILLTLTVLKFDQGSAWLSGLCGGEKGKEFGY